MQNIEISCVTDCHDALMRIFQKFGPNCRAISMKNTKIDDFTLREILKQAGKLETLILREASVTKKLPAINPVSMRTLKELKITNSSWDILNFITAQITNLRIKSYLDEGSRSNLINFLAQQRQLKKLSLCGTSSRTLFQQDDVTTSCNLRSLQLDHDFGRHSVNVNRNIIAFIDRHSDSLGNISISGPYCDEINCFVIANVANINSLTVDARGLPRDDDVYDLMEHKPNMNLKTLTIYGFFLDTEVNKKILKKYPAIEKLELNQWGNETSSSELLEFVSKNCPKLKELVIDGVPLDSVRFPSLQVLAVKTIPIPHKLLQFINQHPLVEKLSVKFVREWQITQSFIDGLKHHEHLKHLSFLGNFKAMQMILELMKKGNPPKCFKVLQMKFYPSTEDVITPKDWKVVKFMFPINSTTEIRMK